MNTFLRRRWFLLLVTLGVALACSRPELFRPWTTALDPRVVVAGALGLMALGLESRSLARALLRPLPACWALVLSYTLVPASAWAAGFLLADADLRVGLLIMASVPCTLASAVLWTRLAQGNEATALLAVLLTTGTSWLATTAWLTLAAGVQTRLEAATLMRGLLLVLVLPVAVGQGARALPPLARAVTRHRQVLGVVSQLLVLTVLLKAAVDLRDRLATAPTEPGVAPLLLTALLALVVHVTALAAGLWSSRGLGFDRPSQVAVAFACSQKTLPVGLFLFEAYFRDTFPLAVVPMVFYHVGQLVADTFIADTLAGQAPRAADVPEEVV